MARPRKVVAISMDIEAMDNIPLVFSSIECLGRFLVVILGACRVLEGEVFLDSVGLLWGDVTEPDIDWQK